MGKEEAGRNSIDFSIQLEELLLIEDDYICKNSNIKP